MLLAVKLLSLFCELAFPAVKEALYSSYNSSWELQHRLVSGGRLISKAIWTQTENLPEGARHLKRPFQLNYK